MSDRIVQIAQIVRSIWIPLRPLLSLPLLSLILLSLTLTGCAQVNTAFAGVALAGLLLVLTLGVLNFLARGADSKKAQLIRTVVIALLLGTMIGMLVLIVVQSGIGKI